MGILHQKPSTGRARWLTLIVAWAGAIAGIVFETAPGEAHRPVTSKYTYAGDTDLDGQVTSNDYNATDQGFLFGYTGWLNGDFNYDGQTTSDDYGMIDFNLPIQGVPFSTAGGFADPPALQTSALTAVPEPSFSLIMGIAALSVPRRRKRGVQTQP